MAFSTNSTLKILNEKKLQLSETIAQSLKNHFQLTFAADVIFDMIGHPPDLEKGDFALACFRWAKDVKKSPQDVAAILGNDLAANPLIESTSVEKGFLNFFLKKAMWFPRTIQQDFSKPFPANKIKVMIEYSQPNTHKEFHVGHVRNTCLGASLTHLFKFCGYSVTPVNYFGDEGTHIAKCLWYIKKNNMTPPEQNRGAWLGQMYVEAVNSNPPENETSDILAGIESKKGEMYDLWKKTREWSLDSFREVYQWLDAPFDREFFESEVSEESQKIVDEYLKKGVFVESDGAVGISLEDKKLGFMIVRKRDGNTLYATKDLVLARKKFEEFKIDRSIYVVAQEQEYHFKQVFETLRRMGFAQAEKCFHLSYGLVTLPEGKMSSRTGNTISFDTLRQTISETIAEKMGDRVEESLREQSLYQVTSGAMKYGMLQADPHHQIVFQKDAWTSFEGNSGPYLMYTYARMKSILKKAGDFQDADFSKLIHNCERLVVLALDDFYSAVHSACENFKPSLLAHYLFELCQSANYFYRECPILKCDDVALRNARLQLISSITQVLHTGFSLLGITPSSQM